MDTIQAPTPQRRTPRRAQRRDGSSTRSDILEAAGRVFAERGFAEATSKEICERAGTNSAAVNYHFGGKDGLYEAVLVEAHRQMMNLEDLERIVSSPIPAEEKLRGVLTLFIRTAAASSDLWGVRIFLRELASPSPFVHKMLTTTMLPKALKIRALVHELTGLPEDSDLAQRAAAFMIMPCVGFLMFPERLRTVLLPATAANSEGLVDAMVTYALGGLAAIRKTEQAAK